jgi:hypothetical protein
MDCYGWEENNKTDINTLNLFSVTSVSNFSAFIPAEGQLQETKKLNDNARKQVAEQAAAICQLRGLFN